MDKIKKEAEKIDFENNKILKAILRVKPTNCIKVNKKSIEH